ncbi:LGFP repeat-containing protein [Dietzia lutea]|uniref:LGFP repeat-containing protein n=1 Tax=Dietzia lutea TaxID=546160 RepID=A0A2S1R7Z6_9ACTN|nr:hypothetical protein [Dietzia lutea]AWH92402.1 hypothetical protein A6035_09765 [Dietzia lutea]
MDRITRVLAPLALAVFTGAGLVACSSDDGPTAGDSAAPASPSAVTPAETATTTSSTPVPGPAGSPVDIPAAVAQRWEELGGEQGTLGRVTGPATEVAGGSVVDFERGAIVLTPRGRPFVVQGEILAAYREAGGPAGDLGFPTADEATTDGGWISTFEGGVITYLDGVAEVETD